MSDPREVLAEIHGRARPAMDEFEAVTDPEESQDLWAFLMDAAYMHAALRAVLSNHWCIEGGEDCGFDGRLWPCPDYRAITEALGGGL
jgi:hypothetical protein